MAKRLGLQVKNPLTTEKLKKESKSEKLYQLMEKAAESDLFRSIEDPVAWQREQRKDRILPGRNK